MTGFAVNVKVSGPLFRVAPRAEEVIHRATNGTIRELVEIGESKLAQMLRPRPAGVFLSVAEARKGQASQGHYRRNLYAVIKDLRGVISNPVIYSEWLEGVGSRNATTRFKGYGVYRRVKTFLDGKVKQVAQAHVRRAVAELNG